MPPPTGTDRRYGYIRVLAKEAAHSRLQYQEKHWKFCCTWIAQLGIEEGPLASRHAVQQLPQVGDECIKLLKQAEDEKDLNITPPKRGFCSAAAAMLVALLEHEEAAARQGKPPPSLCPKGTLIEQAGKLMSTCSMQTFKSLQAHLMASDAAGGAHCASLSQMRYLTNQGLVKERARKGACPSGVVYELREPGRRRALALRKDGEARELLAPKRSHRRVQPGERGVVLLLVDHREGGGEARKGYWDLTDELMRQDVRFETRALSPGAGDFQLVLADGPVDMPPVTAPGRERSRLPHIIERKGSGDVVASLRDGRWGTQQANMAEYNAREFGGRAKVYYLLERLQEPAPPWACSCARCTPKTGDERATGGCLRQGFPTVRAVGEAIAEAEQEYEVVRTQSFSETVNCLRLLQQSEQAKAATASPASVSR